MSLAGTKRAYGPSAPFKRPRTTKVVSKQSVKSMVSQALRQVAEKKWFDTLASGQNPTTGGAFPISNANSIDDGTLDTERVGAKIQLTAVQYHFEGALASTDTASNLVRLILYADKQPNGATATVTQILQNNDFLSFRNLDNLDRFDILDDSIVELKAEAGVSGTLVMSRCYKGIYKKVNYPVAYASDAGTFPISGACIGLLVIAKSATGVYSVRTRVRFMDV